ncbi:MAG: sensor histidine kinase, partial [Candidatus Halalkalibacterium sp. M3_1C_030]
LSNCIKFTPKGGEVTIQCRFEDGHGPGDTGKLITTVRDTGIGMSQEQLDSLFSEKKEGGRPGTENESSYGLGMLIVDRLCEICNATIEVESKENKGTEFRVEWPVKRA